MISLYEIIFKMFSLTTYLYIISLCCCNFGQLIPILLEINI